MEKHITRDLCSNCVKISVGKSCPTPADRAYSNETKGHSQSRYVHQHLTRPLVAPEMRFGSVVQANNQKFPTSVAGMIRNEIVTCVSNGLSLPDMHTDLSARSRLFLEIFPIFPLQNVDEQWSIELVAHKTISALVERLRKGPRGAKFLPKLSTPLPTERLHIARDLG